MEIILSIFLGIGLSAACGFRIFIPLLIMSISSFTGYLSLSESFDWIGTLPALIAFSLATAFEIAAYYIPWLDNLLDAISFPTAFIAGILVSVSAMAELDPLLSWSVGVIAGGGSAVTINGMTSLIRAASSVATGGLGNPVVSTLEAIGSVILSIMAIVIPVLAFSVTCFMLFFGIRKITGWLKRRKDREVFE